MDEVKSCLDELNDALSGYIQEENEIKKELGAMNPIFYEMQEEMKYLLDLLDNVKLSKEAENRIGEVRRRLDEMDKEVSKMDHIFLHCKK